jgi:hypothetical protein
MPSSSAPQSLPGEKRPLLHQHLTQSFNSVPRSEPHPPPLSSPEDGQTTNLPARRKKLNSIDWRGNLQSEAKSIFIDSAQVRNIGCRPISINSRYRGVVIPFDGHSIRRIDEDDDGGGGDHDNMAWNRIVYFLISSHTCLLMSLSFVHRIDDDDEEEEDEDDDDITSYMIVYCLISRICIFDMA